jgi:acetolactate synthase I/II/III large subunit
MARRDGDIPESLMAALQARSRQGPAASRTWSARPCRNILRRRWGSAASLVRPHKKVISISGDGGFLFSSMELETAVRLKAHVAHMIWIDRTYDMVAEQEILKYGRPSGCDFEPVDPVKYAEAFGAAGMMIRTVDEIGPTLAKAMATSGPVIIGVHVDYTDNRKLFEMVDTNSVH